MRLLHLKSTHFFRGRTPRGRRAVTLLEVIVASAIGLIVTLGIVSFSLFISKLNKSTFSQLKFSHYTRRTIEDIAELIRYSKRMQVVDDGMRLLCTDEFDVTSAVYFSDADATSTTLHNNRLYYAPDISRPRPEVIGRYISPFPGRPIFAYIDRTSAVEVNFRVGDPTENPRSPVHIETGPGPQGIDVHAAFGPRNNYLD